MMKNLTVLLWITTLYSLVDGFQNTEGTAVCLNPENLHT
jgi:hypothetical protein